MCHSLVMNYGLYKKMEIFVGRHAVELLCGAQAYVLLASQTCYETRNDAVSFRRIRRLSQPDNTHQHELICERAA